jgi:hypothetical protein
VGRLSLLAVVALVASIQLGCAAPGDATVSGSTTIQHALPPHDVKARVAKLRNGMRRTEVLETLALEPTYTESDADGSLDSFTIPKACVIVLYRRQGELMVDSIRASDWSSRPTLPEVEAKVVQLRGMPRDRVFDRLNFNFPGGVTGHASVTYYSFRLLDGEITLCVRNSPDTLMRIELEPDEGPKRSWP